LTPKYQEGEVDVNSSQPIDYDIAAAKDNSQLHRKQAGMRWRVGRYGLANRAVAKVPCAARPVTGADRFVGKKNGFCFLVKQL